jgi:hypothetical protein
MPPSHILQNIKPIERSISGVYGIYSSNIKKVSLKDFVRIGKALSIQSRMADYERLLRGSSDAKYPKGLKTWLMNNPDFQFCLLSENQSLESDIIKTAQASRGAQFNPIDR